MVVVERAHARELAAQRAHDPELLRLSLQRPYFPPSVPVLPFGPSRLAILCGGRREVLRSTVPHALVRRLLGLCDGTRAPSEIAAALAPDFGGAGEALRNVDELVTLLDRRGLMQDGVPDAADGVPLREAETERFWEQVVAADSVHRSRAALRAAVDRFRVRVLGPASLRGEAEAAIRAAGLRLADAGAPDVALVLYDDPADLCPSPEPLSPLPLQPGTLVLFAGGGPESFRLGPLVPAEAAATVAGWLAGPWLETPSHDRSAPVLEGLRASLSAARLFRLACGLERGRKFNSVEVFARRAPGAPITREIALVSPYVAAATAGPPDPAMLVAAAQSGIEELFSRHLSPRTYLMHYASKNRKLAAGPAPAFHGVPTLALPTADPDADPGADPGAAATMASRLSLLCKWAFGEDEGRRLTPSGGDLRSAALIVNLPQDTDLPAGLYRYRDADHLLERLGAPLVGAETGLPDTGPSFLVVSRLRRVARKYQDAAYKICGLDAGVSSAVLMEAAARLGLDLVVRTDLDMGAIERRLPLPFLDDRHMLSLCLAAPDGAGEPPHEPEHDPLDDPQALHEPRLPHWIVALGKAPLRDRQLPAPAEPQPSLGDLARMEEVLRARRAVRLLPPAPLPPETILALLAEARAGAARHAPSLAPHLRLVAVDRARGLVAAGCDGRPRWSPGIGDTRVFWQSVPDMAPALLVAGLEMAPLARDHGAPGYRYALQALGAGLHLAWLGACARGLQGTLLGGVFNEGLNACLPGESWRIAPIAGLAVGQGARS